MKWNADIQVNSRPHKVNPHAANEQTNAAAEYKTKFPSIVTAAVVRALVVGVKSEIFLQTPAHTESEIGKEKQRKA